MSGLPTALPEEIGLVPAQLHLALELLENWTRTGKVPAACLCVGRRGRLIGPLFFGRQRPEAQTPLRKDALFLVASITKPVIVSAVMKLVERGQVALEDRVAAYVPKFALNGKQDVQVRHLMTHTSGLPNMLPTNEELRAAQKPLAAFIDDTCRQPLLFPPGTQVSYQSMGTALLAEIVHEVTGISIHEFLRKEIFMPLRMSDTSLGWQPEKKDRMAAIQIPHEQQKTNWNWNSPYWLAFGAPWGGMVTSPADFARYCQMMLNGGHLDGARILSPASVLAMTTNQLVGMGKIPEEERRCRPWGLGWRLNWPGHSVNFGDLLGPRTYGHWGSTGTMCWLDPDTGVFCILFTTQPQGDEGHYLVRIANVIAAAIN